MVELMLCRCLFSCVWNVLIFVVVVVVSGVGVISMFMRSLIIMLIVICVR